MSAGELLRGLRGRLGGAGRGSRPPNPAGAFPAAMLELAHRGPAPLVQAPTDPRVQAPAGACIRIAVVVPSFRRGSGGHSTIVKLMRELHEHGEHDVSLWLEDCDGRHSLETSAQTKRMFASFFQSGDLLLHTDFDAWQGADIVLATGWQTVARTLVLQGARARAYLVQDHEPDFYGASAEAMWAAQTYRQELHCIAASAWLAQLLRTRYGASATHFDLGVDHRVYRSGAEQRREDLVVFYARAATPRRAVPLGLGALAELSARRPGLEIVLYGEAAPLHPPFPHRQLGVLTPTELAGLYGRAAVGMVLSPTRR